MPEVTCTHCRKTKSVTIEKMVSLIGKKGRCSACQREFVISSDAATGAEVSVDWNDVLAPTPTPATVPIRSEEELASRIQTSIKWRGAGKWLALPMLVLLLIGGFWYLTQLPNKADDPEKREVVTTPASTEVSPAVTYRISSIEEKNNPDFDGGLQMRLVRVVLTPPPSKAAVEKILNEVYQLFRGEIETLQPNAKHKIIYVNLYDGFEDSNDLICTSETGNFSRLPDTIEAKWRYWRLPEHRPNDEWLALEREYMKGLEAASDAAWEGVNERIIADPVDGKSAMDAVTPRRNARVSILVGKLMEKHHFTEIELARRLSYVTAWKWGLVPSDDLFDEYTTNQLDDWKELLKPMKQ